MTRVKGSFIRDQQKMFVPSTRGVRSPSPTHAKHAMMSSSLQRLKFPLFGPPQSRPPFSSIVRRAYKTGIRRFYDDNDSDDDDASTPRDDGYDGDNEDYYNMKRLERAFAPPKPSALLRPEDIRHILFCKTDKVYDVDLDRDLGCLIVRTSTYLPEKETLVYMQKLSSIVADLNKWQVGDFVKDALKSLRGPLTQDLIIELGINAVRSKEWE